MAAAHPDRNYLGIEVHRPGIGSLLHRLEALGLDNVRIVCGDALAMLEQHIPPGSLGAIYVFFPDPWPKKRHHKRRLVQPEIIALLRTRLRSGGTLELATDWEDYAQHMLHVLEQDTGLRNRAGPGRFSARSVQRPPTRFEQRGLRLGHRVWDLAFEAAATP